MQAQHAEPLELGKILALVAAGTAELIYLG